MDLQVLMVPIQVLKNEGEFQDQVDDKYTAIIVMPRLPAGSLSCKQPLHVRLVIWVGVAAPGLL